MSGPDLHAAAGALASVHRSDWSRIVGALIRMTGDWTLAEDSAQDAFESALAHWPREGVPDNPGAWLMTTARNKAIDRIRSLEADQRRAREVTIMRTLEGGTGDPGAAAGGDGIEDDRLRLIFTCCHPALALPARVALTLRTVCGLSVASIAAAFLVPETTMAQRLVRARRKIEEAAIPYRVPPPELLGSRLTGVLAVVYLVFNEGYGAASDAGLTASAISLGRAVVELMPRESSARGLLALMLLQNSRRDARVGASGELWTLEEQDRSLWHRDEIDEGLALLARAHERDQYVIQASIAAAHARARSAADTDWHRIVALYDELVELMPSPIVELNRAIALGMLESPDAGLAALDRLGDRGLATIAGCRPRRETCCVAPVDERMPLPRSARRSRSPHPKSSAPSCGGDWSNSRAESRVVVRTAENSWRIDDREQPSSQDTMNVFYFIIAFVIFLGGIVLFAFAFNVPQFQALMFLGGIAAISVSLAIPFHVLGHGQQR